MNKENIYIFEGLSSEEISYFILMSETKFYKKGEYIIKEGDPCNDKAYIIEKGSVSVEKNGEKIATIQAGDIVGELALITNEPRTATVIADDDVEVLELLKDDFLMLYQRSGNYQLIKDRILERIKDNFYGIKR